MQQFFFIGFTQIDPTLTELTLFQCKNEEKLFEIKNLPIFLHLQSTQIASPLAFHLTTTCINHAKPTCPLPTCPCHASSQLPLPCFKLSLRPFIAIFALTAMAQTCHPTHLLFLPQLPYTLTITTIFQKK